jgi:putative ABC transport system substrate-binding protein
MSADYGIFTDVVKAVGFLASASAAISLTWKGRARWEPSEEDIPKGPQKVAGLASAVALGLLWSFAAHNAHLQFLKTLTFWALGLCISALLVYGYLVGVQTYLRETTQGGTSAIEKIIGGFWLRPHAHRATQKGPQPLTVQEFLTQSNGNVDRVWSRQSRGLAKTIFTICYLLLTVPGTISLTSASMLVLYKNPPPPPVDKKVVQIGLLLTGQIYFTREIMASFTEELDILLAPTPYSANYEFAVINPDATQGSGAKTVADDLLLKFPSHTPDYLVTIGTQASELAKANYSQIPTIFVGVTDPIKSGLVKSFDPDPERGNIAGVIYGLPVEAYLTFLQSAFGNRRFGFVFNPSYKQDIYLRDNVLAAAQRIHPVMTVVPIEVSNPTITLEQQQMADVFFGRYYVAANLESFVRTSNKPFVAGDISNITKGAIACIAPSSEELGREAARDVLVANLLHGVPLWKMKILGPTQPQTAVNMSAAKRYGIQISESTIEKADRRVE